MRLSTSGGEGLLLGGEKIIWGFVEIRTARNACSLRDSFLIFITVHWPILLV